MSDEDKVEGSIDLNPYRKAMDLIINKTDIDKLTLVMTALQLKQLFRYSHNKKWDELEAIPDDEIIRGSTPQEMVDYYYNRIR